MGILEKLLVSTLNVGKVVSIEDQQTDKQTNGRTDRFRSLLYRYNFLLHLDIRICRFYGRERGKSVCIFVRQPAAVPRGTLC